MCRSRFHRSGPWLAIGPVKRLLDAVWKDLVVTPYSVYQAISILRRTLGDDPKDPRFEVLERKLKFPH